jgi:hypothetical protein
MAGSYNFDATAHEVNRSLKEMMGVTIRDATTDLYIRIQHLGG